MLISEMVNFSSCLLGYLGHNLVMGYLLSVQNGCGVCWRKKAKWFPDRKLFLKFLFWFVFLVKDFLQKSTCG